MKLYHCLRITLAAFLVAIPFSGRATIFFSDTFTNGSTLNSASPANPTTTNTAYEMVASKAWSPTPTMTANDLKMGIGATTSGYFEVQALFATNQLALTQPGDYIQLTVVFTNTTGLLTAAGQLGFGLYNSGQIKPIPSGINNTIGNTYTGYAQNWQGYVGQINYAASASQIITRPTQPATTGRNQDLVTTTTSSSYQNAATVGSSLTANLTLTAGATYTEVLYITLSAVNSLNITNILYSGPDTSGTVLTNFGGVATNGTFLTSGFDGLAIGYTGRGNTGGNPLFDISSIKVDGSVTVISSPPTITAQPVPVTVATNGSSIFNITATGFNMTYQWRRNNTNLLNGGNISGATSTTLVVNYASPADALAGANGYYCVVSGAGGYSTNSATNSLTLVAAQNLIWSGSANPWDLNTSANWQDTNGNTGLLFNYGDNVTFNDTGAGVANVQLSGSFLSASQWLISGSTAYAFSSSGSFAGTGSLIFNSAASGNLQLDLVNTHTGGTIVSNDNSALNLYLSKYQVLGNGPLTLAKPGLMEFVPTGSATLGIPSDVTVNDDFTLQFDGQGSFAGVILGNLSGTATKSLTLTPQNLVTTNRYRVYGTNTVCNANIVLKGNATDQAQYYGTVLAPYNATGTQIYNGTISDAGGILQRGSGTAILNTANTYTGGTTPSAGSLGLGNDAALGTGVLNIAPETGSATGSGTIFAYGGARTIANTVQYPSGTNNQTLIIGGTNDITFTSAINLAGVDGTGNPVNRTLTVNNSGATTFSGALSDSSVNNVGLIKNGTNTLYLNNAANTYPGLTTVTAGTLAGSGSLAGSVLVGTNSRVGGGAAAGIGTLSISGSLVISNGGGGFFRLNKTGLASDKVSVTASITNFSTSTIVVTNFGGSALAAGDKFFLFNKGVTNGGTLSVTGALTSGLTWSNGLAVDGSISAIVSSTDLAISMTAIAQTNPAANFSYSITATNQGAAVASSVVVTSTLPASLTFVSANGGGVNNAGVVSWSLGSLSPNQASNLTLTVTAPLYGFVTNTASVSSGTTDSNPANNLTSQIITTIVPVTSTKPVLTNTISSGTLTLQWGLDRIGYTLLVQTNTLTTGLGNNWIPVAGSATTNKMNRPIDVTKDSVFYKLSY